MKIRKTGMSRTRGVPQYRDPEGALQTTITTVDTVRVVEVDELLKYCEAYADKSLGMLRDDINEGKFG